MATPQEETALEAYRLCVTKASELGVYNRWTVRSLEQLHKLRPEEYPLVTERLLPLKYDDKMVVQGNQLIIPDTDTYKGVDLVFKGADEKEKDKDKGRDEEADKDKDKDKDNKEKGKDDESRDGKDKKGAKGGRDKSGASRRDGEGNR